MPLPTMQALAAAITKQAKAGVIMHRSLGQIVMNQVHHPECVMERCRATCPVKIAGDALQVKL